MVHVLSPIRSSERSARTDPSAGELTGRRLAARVAELGARIGRIRGASETLREDRNLRCRFMVTLVHIGWSSMRERARAARSRTSRRDRAGARACPIGAGRRGANEWMRMKDECWSLSSAPAATVDLRLCSDGTPAGANGHTCEGLEPRMRCAEAHAAR
jgi:hypothetical protein